MAAIVILLCFCLGAFIPAQSVGEDQDAIFSQTLPGFFRNILPFPFKSNLEFPPYDTIFSSWRKPAADFHMLADMPPLMMIPGVQVYCDESRLTLLIDKRLDGVALDAQEVRLGDGCYSNGELPNQFVLAYNFDQCGTARQVQNGLEVFTNSLHFTHRTPPSPWRVTPPTVHVSCIPKRSNPDVLVSAAPPEDGRSFRMRDMNPSWTGAVEPKIYKRGQVVNLQVSARTRRDEQLFIQSCFISASPEPQAKPRRAILMNKGCTAPLGSPHAVVQFADSKSAGVVNFILNTTYLISEMYIHCSVLISDQGITSGSKFCNYNVIRSRWEELGGDVEVCSCCSSRCKGLSVRHLPHDAKAIVSSGRLVIMDRPAEGPAASVLGEETSGAPATNSIQSDAAILAEASNKISDLQRPSPPNGVVVVSQDPDARLTLWLPGQMQDSGCCNDVGSQLAARLQPGDAIPELLPSSTDQEPDLNSPNQVRGQGLNEVGGEAPVWDLNVVTLVSGLPLHAQLEKAAAVEESQRWKRFEGSEKFVPEATRPADGRLPPGSQVTDPDQNIEHMKDEASGGKRQQENRPVILSRLQFSKSPDGSQTLSYEEDVTRDQGANARLRKRQPRQKDLLAAFLDLFRRMDKGE